MKCILGLFMGKKQKSIIIDKKIVENKKNNIETYIVESVEEYISLSGNLINQGYWVSRGHSNLEWKLLPSVMRPELLKTINIVDAGYDYESLTSTEFMDKYNYYLNLKLDKEDFTSHLIAMQHYDLPTRLLDWTLNPQTSLFFAMNYKEEVKDETAIWFANPALFNCISLKQNGRLYLRQETSDVNLRSELAFFKNREQIRNSSMLYPVFFKPKYMFDRIVVQESVFSIFGFETISIEEMLGFSECLKCVIIKDNNRNMYNEINNNLKLYYDKYFPDIHGFVIGMKRGNKK